jgi:hypothetical protein
MAFNAAATAGSAMAMPHRAGLQRGVAFVPGSEDEDEEHVQRRCHDGGAAGSWLVELGGQQVDGRTQRAVPADCRRNVNERRQFFDQRVWADAIHDVRAAQQGSPSRTCGRLCVFAVGQCVSDRAASSAAARDAPPHGKWAGLIGYRTRRSMRVAVYGAYGYQGRLTVPELIRRGIEPVLIGRNGDRLRAAAEVPDIADADVRVAAIDDPGGMAGAFAGLDAVINCAGPFTLSGTAVARQRSPPAATISTLPASSWPSSGSTTRSAATRKWRV